PGHSRLKTVEGGESVMSVELPCGPMTRVGAARGSYVDLSSRRSTYFGGIGAGLNLEFVNRVNRGRETETIAIQVHRFDAIVIIPVLRVTGAIGGHADG